MTDSRVTEAPVSIGADLQELEAGKRKRAKTLGLAGAAIVMLACAAFTVRYFQTRSDLPPVPADRMAKMQKALPELANVAPEHHNALGFAGLAETEKGRLPEVLVEAFDQASNGWPGARSRALLEALASPDIAKEWKRTCADRDALASMVRLTDVDQGRMLYAQCKLDRLGFLSADEAARVEGPVLAATSLVHDYLKRHNTLTETEVALLRLAAVDSLVHAKEQKAFRF